MRIHHWESTSKIREIADFITRSYGRLVRCDIPAPRSASSRL